MVIFNIFAWCCKIISWKISWMSTKKAEISFTFSWFTCNYFFAATVNENFCWRINKNLIWYFFCRANISDSGGAWNFKVNRKNFHFMTHKRVKSLIAESVSLMVCHVAINGSFILSIFPSCSFFCSLALVLPSCTTFSFTPSPYRPCTLYFSFYASATVKHKF